MTYDPEMAAILRERLAIEQLLDISAELSFLERATLRMELLGILDDFEQHRETQASILTDLSYLHGRVVEATTSTWVDAPAPHHPPFTLGAPIPTPVMLTASDGALTPVEGQLPDVGLDVV